MDQSSKRDQSEPHTHATSSRSKTHIEEKYIGEEKTEQPGVDDKSDNIHEDLKTIRAFMARFIANESQTVDSKNAQVESPKVVRVRSPSQNSERSRSPIRSWSWGQGLPYDNSYAVPGRGRNGYPHNSAFIPPPVGYEPVPVQTPAVSQPIQPPQTPYYGGPVYLSQDNRILDSVITDFSSIVVIATFMASVSIGLLTLAGNLISNSPGQNITANKTLYVILQIFASLSLSFNLAVAIIAGGAASNQSARLRAGLRAKPYTKQQGLEPKLQLCSAMQYYGLLALTVATGCLFGLLLDSPFAIIMIIPVIGVVFYDSLYRGPLSTSTDVGEESPMRRSQSYSNAPYPQHGGGW